MKQEVPFGAKSCSEVVCRAPRATKGQAERESWEEAARADHYGSLNVTGPQRPAGSGTIRGYDFAGGSVSHVQTVFHFKLLVLFFCFNF